MSELNPCPFCGSSDVEQDYGSNFVVCNGCKAAAKATFWNIRTNSISIENIIEAKTIERVLAAVEKVLHEECVDVGSGDTILAAIKAHLDL